MNDITIPALPADLPEDFQLQDIIAPNGADIGKPVQRGYNYLMQQMNETQRAVMKMAEESNSAFETKANIDYVNEQFAQWAVDGGGFEDDPVVVHNANPSSHPNMLAYGGSLEEHLIDPNAHPDIVLDGNLN